MDLQWILYSHTKGGSTVDLNHPSSIVHGWQSFQDGAGKIWQCWHLRCCFERSWRTSWTFLRNLKFYEFSDGICSTTSTLKSCRRHRLRAMYCRVKKRQLWCNVSRTRNGKRAPQFWQLLLLFSVRSLLFFPPQRRSNKLLSSNLLTKFQEIAFSHLLACTWRRLLLWDVCSHIAPIWSNLPPFWSFVGQCDHKLLCSPQMETSERAASPWLEWFVAHLWLAQGGRPFTNQHCRNGFLKIKRVCAEMGHTATYPTLWSFMAVKSIIEWERWWPWW